MKEIKLKINFPAAKDLPISQTEMFANTTESFETTGMLAVQPKDNETWDTGEWRETASNLPPMTSSTAAQLSTPLPQNRFFVPTDATDQNTVPNESPDASNMTSTHSTQINGTSNTRSHNGNTPFSKLFTTIKPCKAYVCLFFIKTYYHSNWVEVGRISRKSAGLTSCFHLKEIHLPSIY